MACIKSYELARQVAHGPETKRVWNNSTSSAVMAASMGSQARSGNQYDRRCASSDYDCTFRGSVVYFQAAEKQTIRATCLQCRAIDFALREFRSQYSSTANYDRGTMASLIRIRLDLWAQHHGVHQSEAEFEQTSTSMSYGEAKGAEPIRVTLVHRADVPSR